MKKSISLSLLCFCVLLCSGLFLSAADSKKESLDERDLSGVMARKELRHLGVPYAGFVRGNGDGLDVEVMKMFAQYLGVKYVYVETSWPKIIPELVGYEIKVIGDEVQKGAAVEVRGDVIGCGLTMLDWRKKALNFSSLSFPTQVWLVASARSQMKPIKPSGKIEDDIKAVKSKLYGIRVFGVKDTCLDPDLYGLEKTGVEMKLFTGNLNRLAPAVVNGDAEATLLDVPDSLIALQKWPGRLKVVGPISEEQGMGFGFSKDSPEMLKRFEEFFTSIKKSGVYGELARKYYPNVSAYYPDFISPAQE